MADKMKLAVDPKEWPWPVDEAALVSADIDGQKELVLFMPDKPDDWDCPDAIVFLAACAAAWKNNDEFVAALLNWFCEGGKTKRRTVN